MSAVERLAREIYDTRRLALGHATHPQINNTSVEGGAIPIRDGNGNEIGRIGIGDDGSFVIDNTDGPKPPKPTMPMVSADAGMIRVDYDGKFADYGEQVDVTATQDLDRVEVHASQDPNFVPDRVVSYGGAYASLEGGSFTLGPLADAGTWYVRLVARSKAGKFSVPSDLVEVEVAVAGVDLEITNAWLTGEAAQTTADGKNAIFRGPDEPVNDPENPFKVGDIWFEMTPDGKSIPNQWDGTQWVGVDDYRQSQIEKVQAELRKDLDAVIVDGTGTSNFYKPVAPDPAGAKEGDLWFDSSEDGKNAVSILENGVWVKISDKRIEEIRQAQADLDAEITEVEARASAEAKSLADQARTDAAADATSKADAAKAAAITAAAADAKAKADKALADAKADAAAKDSALKTQIDSTISQTKTELNTSIAGVQTSVNGKTTITWNDAAPSKTSNPGKTIGDTWYRTSGSNIIGFWRWNGSDWVAQSLATTVIPKIDIGVGTFGNLSGGRIEAKSIDADAILVPGSAGSTVIRDGAITTAKIAAEAIDAGKIKAGAITASHIQAGAITIGSVPDLQSVLDGKETPSGAQAKADAAKDSAVSTAASDATAKASAAQSNAISSAADNANTVFGETKTLVSGWRVSGKTTIAGGVIETDSIKTAQLAAGSVTADILAAGSVITSKIATDAVDARTVKAGAIGAVAIAADAIEGRHVKAGTITADKLLIGSDRNLIPNGDLSKGSAIGWPSVFTYQNTDTPPGFAGAANISGTASGQWPYDLYPVSPGDTIVYEAWVKADKPNSRIYQEVRDQSGAHLGRSGYGWERVESTAAQQIYPIAAFTVPTSWTKVVSRIKVAPGVTGIRLSAFYPNHSSGTERTATCSIAGVKLYTQAGSTLIQDGAITTAKIATGAITADSGIIGSINAGVITVGEMDGARIKAGTISADTALIGGSLGSTIIRDGAVTTAKIAVGAITAESGIIGSIDANTITVGKIMGNQLDADAVNGKTITGATIRTASSGARVELTQNGLRQYNALNAVLVDMTSGSFSVTGGSITGSTIRTAESGSRIEITTSGLKQYSASGALVTEMASGAMLLAGDLAVDRGKISFRGDSRWVEGRQVMEARSGDEGQPGLYAYSTNSAYPGEASISLRTFQPGQPGSWEILSPPYSDTEDGRATAVLGRTFGVFGWRRKYQSGSVTNTQFGASIGAYREGDLYLMSVSGSAPSTLAASISLNRDKSAEFASEAGGKIQLSTGGAVSITARDGIYMFPTANTELKIEPNNNLSAKLAGINWMPPNGSSSDTIVRVTGAGWLVKQGTSSRRFKTDIEPLESDDRLLDIQPITFHYAEQKQEFEAGPDTWSETNKDVFANGLPLHRGVIAEDLEEMGLTHLVGHDSDGDPYSVAYDQMGFELIPIVARLRDRINDLENRLAAVEAA